MLSANLHHYCNDSQYLFVKPKGFGMDDQLFYSFIDGLITDYAKDVDGSFDIDISDLTTADQREFLKQYMFWGKDDFNIDDWQRIVAFPSLYPAFFDECKQSLNNLLTSRANDIYSDVKRSSGFSSYQDSNTGETLWGIK